MNNAISSRVSRIPIYVMIGVAVVCLAASFDHLSSVLKTFGYSDIVAYPLAVAIDLYILSMLFLCWQRTHWMLQALLALGIIASGSANFFAGMEHGWFSAVYSLVPIVLIKAVYLALWSISKTPNTPAASTIATPVVDKRQTFEEITAPLREELADRQGRADDVRERPQGLSDEDLRARMTELDAEMKERAQQFVRDNPEVSARELARRFKRSQTWASDRISKAGA